MVQIALGADEMFQRAVARRVVFGSELLFTTANGREYRGFPTGLDEDWIQITTTADQTAVWLSLQQIVSMEETGKKIKDFDPVIQEKINKFQGAFKEACIEAHNKYKLELKKQAKNDKQGE
ncbi:hypothetical protein [Streptomyces sp. CoH17]|uniref:hypothetical protein n=1 Tax=Streptomyces sp. CoH17 TaxID=2992806 RepID=UPI002270BA57|nr:hypothetical protein [Streptomyces sp. CoH17]